MVDCYERGAVSSARARAVSFLESRGLCGIDEEGHAVLIEELRESFDAAERRGKIAVLKWLRDWPSDKRYSAIVSELARLRAEEGK